MGKILLNRRRRVVTMNSLLNWNDNLVAIFEAKLTSIAFVGAVDTTNVPTFDVFT